MLLSAFFRRMTILRWCARTRCRRRSADHAQSPTLVGCRISAVLRILLDVWIYRTPPTGDDQGDAVLEGSDGEDESDFQHVEDFDVEQNSTSDPDAGYAEELRTKLTWAGSPGFSTSIVTRSWLSLSQRTLKTWTPGPPSEPSW